MFFKTALEICLFSCRHGGSAQEDLKAHERVRMCIKCVAYKDSVPLFASPCFLKLANLYEEDL